MKNFGDLFVDEPDPLTSFSILELAGAAQEFFVGPVAAAAGLAGDDEVEAGDEGDVLTAGAGLGAGIGGEVLRRSGGPIEASGKFPAVGEDLRIDFQRVRASGRCEWRAAVCSTNHLGMIC